MHYGIFRASDVGRENGGCAGAGAVKSCWMCTLAIYFRVTGDCPVVIAANRDEFLRPRLTQLL